MIRVATTIAIAVTVSAISSTASAQTNEMLAQSLFEQGRVLMDQGRYAEACPKLAESQRLDPGGGTLLNLGLCHEKEGKLATANAVLTSALTTAIKDGRADRERIAREHVEAVAKRMPRVSIHVTMRQPDMAVSLDGTAINAPAWDVPTGVDPGTHSVDASAAGFVPQHIEVTVKEGETRTVVIPMLVVAGSAPQPPPDSNASTTSSTNQTTTKANPLYTAALISGVAGLGISVITGAIWGINAAIRSDNCNEDRGYCTQKGLDASDAEKTYGWASTISLGISAIGFTSLLFLPSRVTVDAAPTKTGAAASLRLAF